MNNSRTKNSFLNISSGIGGYIITYLFSFIVRTIFIRVLGKEYLGIQGLLGNILSMLSLAELGINSAITFSLYKPIAEKNTDKIKKILNLFRQFYKYVIIAVALLGIACVPFLDFFVLEKPQIKESLEVIFLLYLIDTIASYILIYKVSLLRADQKEYIISLVKNALIIIRDLIHIIWLLLTHDFIGTLCINIVITLAINAILSYYADKKYPYLKEKDNTKLESEERKEITSNIFAMAKYRLGAFVVDGTDGIIISKFVGIVETGLYSNYQLIFVGIKKIASLIFSALTPSVGNYVHTNNKEESRSLFLQIIFANLIIGTICTTCIFILINPFITIWIGSDFCFSTLTVVIFAINFYFNICHQSMLIFRNALGLYIYMQWKPIAEAIINLVVSIVLVYKLGVAGVFLGTIISYLLTGFWIEPYVLYRKYLNSGLMQYMGLYFKNLLITVGSCLIVFYIQKMLPIGNSIILWILYGFLCVAVSILLIILLYRNTSYYKELKLRIVKIIGKIKNHG